MPDTLATDRPLTAAQEATLNVVLDQIIPADESRGKPSAVDVGVLVYLLDRHADELQTIASELDNLNELAIAKHQQPYSELVRSVQDSILATRRTENVRFLMGLAVRTVECYYLDARVMQAIGLPARAPYPEGFTVHKGDLTLLDPVRARGSIWRRTDIEQK